ncbi:uncharacterized protein LOC115890190 [Sitophilus oryzae]|uniref:Uncharacterized protein LOC115890190 n=1 Tax=Sitophilus oryzae TaxID=7048 RepID=A0A6J2YTR5_SITOR|nr:uncharacterized protein LOC115890190 [Sitophilus oryzae]
MPSDKHNKITVYNGTIGVRSQQVVLIANNILWRTSKSFKWNEAEKDSESPFRTLYLIVVRVDAVLHQCELNKLMVMDILTAAVTTQRTSCSFEGKFLIGYRKMSVVSGCKVNRTRVGLDICCLLIMISLHFLNNGCPQQLLLLPHFPLSLDIKQTQYSSMPHQGSLAS